MSTIANKKAACIDTMLLQFLYFLKKDGWVKSYTIADDTGCLGAENT
jgi:hypothetical protein